MKKFISLHAVAWAAAIVATPAAAQDAADNRGVYVALHGGVASVNDVDITYLDQGGTFGGTGTTDTADFKAEFKNAFGFGGAIGYDFGLIRADVEIDYARNRAKALTLKSINGSAVTLTDADRADVCAYLEADSCGGSGNTFNYEGSRVRQLSALANLWVDVPTGSIVTPYVGGGLGVAGYEVDGEGKARFAWQLGAGVSVDVTPSVSLTADFRHRQTNGATITDEDFADVGVEIGKVKTNTFSAGVRFRF